MPVAVPAKPVAAYVSNKLTTPSVAVTSVLNTVVETIASYLLTTGADDKFEATGRSRLTSVVDKFIRANERISMVLPAFPFKSPSTKKTLGRLPDLAEEHVLRRLEDICRAIEDVYEPGAQLYIVSDGVVYGELLGVGDTTVAAYNDELRRITQLLNLTHITFVRVADLLEPGAELRPPMTAEEYIATAPGIRAKFLATEPEYSDVKQLIASDVGAERTYRGYLKFLKMDLEGSPVLTGEDGAKLSKSAREKVLSRIGKAMMLNGNRFSSLVANKFPNAVRLSIHPHDNSGPKFALKVFPTLDLACTPWHNAIVELADGSIQVAHSHVLEQAGYEVIHRYGRPYFYRQHDADLVWDQLPTLSAVSFERMHPFGLRIIAQPEAHLGWNDLPMDKLRRLSFKYSLIVLSGFAPADKEEFTKKTHEIGEVQKWVYGEVLEIKDNPELDMNNVLTREAMPMHFDGCFKIKEEADGNLTCDPPTFQIFQCRQAPSGSDGGRTLFANTSMILQQGVDKELNEVLRSKRWYGFTPLNQVFGGEPLRLPLVVKNEGSGHEVVRWHEDWPQSITSFKPTEVRIDGLEQSESKRLGDRISKLLYDRRFVIQHQWTTGEYVIADNIELMHTRTAFLPCTRELWRIHVK